MIQITEIENGFLVMTPLRPAVVKHMNQPPQQPEPVVQFCADKDAVCNYIQTVLPD